MNQKIDYFSAPPPQDWLHAQMEKAQTMLGVQYNAPSDWFECEHLAQTYYFTNIRTIFTGVPKSGCSNWIEALMIAEGTLTKKFDHTELFKVHGTISMKHRMKYINSNKGIKEDFSFAVIRNPWTRMVSGYRDKLSGEPSAGNEKRDIGMDIVREIRGETDQFRLSYLYPTFEEFLRYLIRYNTTDNNHFTTQHEMLCIPQGRYDYIVPLEYSNIVDKDIWSRINCTVDLSGSYDSASDPRKQTSTQRAKEWLSEIDQEIIDKIYGLYKEDFAMANYSNFTDPNFPLPIYPE
ncbi:carbohydrate sulfotransferase 10-like [Bolinopsis microptera]|uniref:carbohydrate sulfotransferase 10-like n=1 Tax=Bolinopsis microptera TaxID=2820187 RepID=UPI003079D1B4